MKRFTLLVCAGLLLASSMVLTGCHKPLLSTDAVTHHFGVGETEWTFHVWNGGDAKATLEFTVTADTGVTVTGSGESIDINQKVPVTVVIPVGFTSGTLEIESNGGEMEIPITTAADYFTQDYTDGVPLGDVSLTFTPDASSSFFAASKDAATEFPTPPEGGDDITFGLTDPVEHIVLPKHVSFYGVEYDSFWVGSTGVISFGANAQTASAATLADHFAGTQISALSSMDATAVGSKVSVTTTPTLVAVTYENVPTEAKAADDSVNVQVELFFDGTIRLTYLDVIASSGIVGLSNGPGTTPTDFVPSDLTSYNTSGAKTAP